MRAPRRAKQAASPATPAADARCTVTGEGRTVQGTGCSQSPGTGGGARAAGWSTECSSTMCVPSSSSRHVCCSAAKRGAHA